MTKPLNVLKHDYFKEHIAPLKMNLQYFADGAEGEGAGEGGEGDTGESKVELTAEELQKKIEAESDRKLDKVLQKKQKEWEEQQKEAIKKALEEKERLSKLSEKEREEEELTKREQDIAARLAELERRELKADAVSVLKEKDLPAEFADFLLADDSQKTLDNINSFKKAFDEAVNATVKETLRQDPPPAGSSGMGSGKNSIAQLRNQQDQQKNKAPDLWA
ncbi:hypothetical protein CHH72_00500 [Shouchella clausii]|uniref:DUF4355 domain-containing protein n=1 Tax=Shouchella clausii TaxID=79880 RepID=A0A268P5A4_SHOCL|nr:hypothetical protein CHH72_00500 [Shouchella clausii]